MNGVSKRRSARLSAEGAGDENGDDGFAKVVRRKGAASASATTTTVGTKENDGDGTLAAGAKRKKRGKVLSLSLICFDGAVAGLEWALEQ